MRKKNNAIKYVDLLSFSIIQAAVSGNVEAIHTVLKHYEGYIISLATRRMYDESGQPFYCVDESLRRRLEIKLITKVLDFKIV